jgi:hypothetical protein
MQDGRLFPRLIDEYGSKEEDKKFGAKEATQTSAAGDLTTLQVANEKQLVAVLMQVEERNTGAVTWTVYRRYLVYAGSAMWAFIVAAILVSDQGSSGDFYSAPLA